MVGHGHEKGHKSTFRERTRDARSDPRALEGASSIDALMGIRQVLVVHTSPFITRTLAEPCVIPR